MAGPKARGLCSGPAQSSPSTAGDEYSMNIRSNALKAEPQYLLRNYTQRLPVTVEWLQKQSLSYSASASAVAGPARHASLAG